MTLLFFNLGGGEIFMVLMGVLLLFGSKRIPEIMGGLGKGIRQFKDATQDIQDDITSSAKDVKKTLEESKASMDQPIADIKSSVISKPNQSDSKASSNQSTPSDTPSKKE